MYIVNLFVGSFSDLFPFLWHSLQKRVATIRYPVIDKCFTLGALEAVLKEAYLVGRFKSSLCICDNEPLAFRSKFLSENSI